MKRRIDVWMGLVLVPALVLMGCGSETQLSPDTTPPLAPQIAGASFDDGIVGVWWEPNTEPDLAGYYLYVIEDGVSRQANVNAIEDSYIVLNLGGDAGAIQVYVTAIDLSENESSPSETMRAIDSTVNEVREVVGGVPRDH